MNHKARQAIAELEAAGATKTTDFDKEGIVARWYIGDEQVAWLESTGRFGVKLAGQRHVTARRDNEMANGEWTYTDRAQADYTRGPDEPRVEEVLCTTCFIMVPQGQPCGLCDEVPDQR